MTDRELMQQALDALETVTKHFGFARLHESTLADTEARGTAHKAMAILRNRLAQPESKLVEHDFQKALLRAYHLGQRYWADADSESYSANKRADKHRQDFDALCEEAISYTAPPQRECASQVHDRREWQGLTDEEAKRVFEQHNCTISADLAGILARAIKAKLKEKNNGDR